MGLTTSELALRAAKWWAKKVEKPEFDLGDDSDRVQMLIVCTYLNVKSVDQESKNRFISALSEIIQRELKLSSEKSMTLEVDYHPDENLSEAAEIAGVSTTNFPWKTIMWISEDCVSVKYGYRGKMQRLFGDFELDYDV